MWGGEEETGKKRPPSPPLQIMHRNPNDLGSPAEVDLWVRYVATDALEAVLKAGALAERMGGGGGGHGAGGGGGKSQLPEGHAAIEGGAAAVGMGCPVGAGAGGGGAVAAPHAEGGAAVVGSLSPQLYAAMDVDERTAIVHRYLPPSLLTYAETVLQVRRRGEGRRGARTAAGSPPDVYLLAPLLAPSSSIRRTRRSASRARRCCSSSSRASTRSTRDSPGAPWDTSCARCVSARP